MKISLFIIGTELTRGVIKDQHTSFLASQVSKMGYSVLRSVVVPDDGSIEGVLRLAACDSDVLLVTGGLGPTSDDKTRKIIANLAGTTLVKNKAAWDELYRRVGERIYGSNEQQAYIPEGFEVVPNPNGTACGFFGTFVYNSNTVRIACLPGPPAEMQPMFLSDTCSRLAELIGFKEPERDEFSSYLIAEAKLDELCAMCATDGVEWEDRFQQFRISLYIAGEDASKRMEFESKLKKLCGEGLLEDGNYEASDLLEKHLLEEGRTISVCESVTGGLFSKIITDAEGYERWFRGSEICTDTTADQMLEKTGSDLAVRIDEKDGLLCLSFASDRRKSEKIELKLTTFSQDAKRRRYTTCAMIAARLFDMGYSIVDTTSTWLYI